MKIHIVRWNELADWGSDVTQHMSKLYSYYAYDPSMNTYLCEGTPSAALHWLGYEAVYLDGISDETVEKCEEILMQHPADFTYMHHWRVKSYVIAELDVDEEDGPWLETVQEMFNGGERWEKQS